MAKKRQSRRMPTAVAFPRHPSPKALWGSIHAQQSDPACRFGALLRMFVPAEYEEEDLVTLADVESASAAFAAEIIKRIPSQYHQVVGEALEVLIKRLAASLNEESGFF